MRILSARRVDERAARASILEDAVKNFGFEKEQEYKDQHDDKNKIGSDIFALHQNPLV